MKVDRASELRFPANISCYAFIARRKSVRTWDKINHKVTKDTKKEIDDRQQDRFPANGILLRSRYEGAATGAKPAYAGWGLLRCQFHSHYVRVKFVVPGATFAATNAVPDTEKLPVAAKAGTWVLSTKIENPGDAAANVLPVIDTCEV